jgi:murein DD-endopeptidase MepM/ murein hydrolase activator NlpD
MPARPLARALSAPLLGAALVVPLLGAATPATAAPVVPAASVVSSAVVAPSAVPFRWWRMPYLSYGDRGRAVYIVQRKLGVRPTSAWYGPLTRAAVMKFQRSRGIGVTGRVGPVTWKKLAAVHPRSTGATRSRVHTASGRVCPAPGAAFGGGFGAPRVGHLHQGMDLMGRRGSRILAIESGYILREGRQSNGALRIVLQGVSGSKFFYGHMDKDLVRAGQRVTRGQVIGLMGDTGSPGAVHLHFEYWRSGGESDAVDPAPLLRSIC